MGVTIHYGGNLKSIDQLDDLIDEMIEVSNANKWEYQLFPEITSKEKDPLLPSLKGIAFGHDNSEPIWLTFNSKGELLSPIVAMFNQNKSDPIQEIPYNAFTKTQYGGPEYHIKVVNLLKYLEQKYFSLWNVRDESRYYETEDKDHLVECMTIIDRSLTALNEAFEVHGAELSNQSEEEIKNFINKVLGSEAIDIKVIKLNGEEE